MPITLVKDRAEPTSVTGRVLATFLDSLALEDGFENVAERLRAAMLEKGDTSEAALRAALFESGAP